MSELDSMSQEVPATGMEKFLEDNFRKLVWLFVLVVVGIIAAGFLRHQSTLKDQEAAEAFTAAKTVEDCDLVISRYSGTNAAANALLMKADLLWDQNKKSSSVEALKEFTSKHSGHPLYVETLLAFGSKLDSMGDRKEAQAVYERITGKFASSEAAPLAQIRLADLLWADGKKDEAKKAYEDLTVKFPEAGQFQELSERRLEWIAAALPTKEVDPPPAPKVEPKPAPAPGAAAVPKINLNAAPGGLTPTITPPGGAPAPAAGAPAAPKAAAPQMILKSEPDAPKSAPAPAPAPKPAAPPAPAPTATTTPVTPPATPAPAPAAPKP